MSVHTIGDYCQATFSIKSQMTVVRDAIVTYKTSFGGDDLTFLEGVESFINTFLLDVLAPLNDCIERHGISKGDLSTSPHPWNETGC